MKVGSLCGIVGLCSIFGVACESDTMGRIGHAPANFFVESMFPETDATLLSPDSSIYLTFSEALNVASVTESTIRLYQRESKRVVPVEVLFSADGLSVELRPKSPLSVNSRYTIVLDDVESKNNERLNYRARFFTVLHRPKSFTGYKDGELFRFYDASSTVPVCEANCDGQLYDGKISVQYYRAGKDSLQDTEDDVLGNLTRYHYNSGRDNTSYVVRSSPGQDGAYDTPDDVFLYRRVNAWNAMGLYRRHYVFAGADGKLGTRDDFQSGITQWFYDEADRAMGSCDYDAGFDNRAFTTDDETTKCTLVLRNGDVERHFTALGPGPDGEWRTLDDVLEKDWLEISRNTKGQREVTRQYVSPGSSMADRKDSLLVGYQKSHYGEAGTVVSVTSFKGPGPDGVWLSGDDEPENKTVFTYNNENLVKTQTAFEVGEDGLFDTGDDVPLHFFSW